MPSTWSMRCLGCLGETSWSDFPSHAWKSLLLGNAALFPALCAATDHLLGHDMGQTAWLATLSRFLIKADKGASSADEGPIVLYRSIAGGELFCTTLGVQHWGNTSPMGSTVSVVRFPRTGMAVGRLHLS